MAESVFTTPPPFEIAATNGTRVQVRGWLRKNGLDGPKSAIFEGTPQAGQTPDPNPNPGTSYPRDLVYTAAFGPPYRANHPDLPGGSGTPWRTHEGVPNKLNTGFDFYGGSRPGTTFGTQWNGTRGEAFPWGQVFADPSNTHWTDVRFQTRRWQIWWEWPNGTFTLAKPIAGNSHEGALWDGNFKGQGSIPWRNDGVDGMSCALDGLRPGTVNATVHYWMKEWIFANNVRITVPPDVVGYFLAAQCRLIPTTPGTDISGAYFIHSCSADNYPKNPNANALPTFLQPGMNRVMSGEWADIKPEDSWFLSFPVNSSFVPNNATNTKTKNWPVSGLTRNP